MESTYLVVECRVPSLSYSYFLSDTLQFTILNEKNKLKLN